MDKTFLKVNGVNHGKNIEVFGVNWGIGRTATGGGSSGQDGSRPKTGETEFTVTAPFNGTTLFF